MYMRFIPKRRSNVSTCPAANLYLKLGQHTIVNIERLRPPIELATLLAIWLCLPWRPRRVHCYHILREGSKCFEGSFNRIINVSLLARHIPGLRNCNLYVDRGSFPSTSWDQLFVPSSFIRSRLRVVCVMAYQASGTCNTSSGRSESHQGFHLNYM
jgi:hypothetical protein